MYHYYLNSYSSSKSVSIFISSNGSSSIATSISPETTSKVKLSCFFCTTSSVRQVHVPASAGVAAFKERVHLFSLHSDLEQKIIKIFFFLKNLSKLSIYFLTTIQHFFYISGIQKNKFRKIKRADLSLGFGNKKAINTNEHWTTFFF